MTRNKVHIVGVGAAGVSSLEPETMRLVRSASLLIGGERLLSMFSGVSASKMIVKGNLSDVVEAIRSRGEQERIVILASGDPGFLGIAKRLTAELGKERFEIVPNISSMQLAFARIKESWDDAVFVSAHGRPIEGVIEAVRRHRKIGIFTDGHNTPAAIAELLASHGIDGYRAYVCENLGLESERITEADLSGLKGMTFSRLNVLILVKEPTSSDPLSRGTANGRGVSPAVLGIPDSALHHRGTSKGQITKQEIRAVSLAKLRIREDSIVWDIGAGSGAISIEAAHMARQGRVFAIERSEPDAECIRRNIRKFGRGNVEVFRTEAPAGLDRLPDPDCVFVGGSGGRIGEIIAVVCARLKPAGRIVLNLVTFQNLNDACRALAENGFETEIVLVNIARGAPAGNLTRLEPLSPVFVVTGVSDRRPGRDRRDPT